MYTIANRANAIASIIAKRRPLVERIASVESNLQMLVSAISGLERYSDRIISQVDDAKTIRKLREVDLARLQHKISEELEKLAILKSRFSRQTINIGVVGLMGQGKSTLLKSLSGLTDSEIPALEGSACTAVRSTIVNHSGETAAEVILHSEDSFLEEIIYPYYDKLGFIHKPLSLNEFATSPFPQNQIGGASNEQMYNHFQKDYYVNLSQYRDLLKPEKPRNISINRDDIPEYVMQRRDAQGNLNTFKHLAVKEVKVSCQFQNPDVGEIALVDIPGLGDSKLGDEDLMLNTLGKEVDIVLFIRRPDPQRYQWKPEDTNLYDIAGKALNNLPNRAFMILNHSQRIDNLKACQEMQASLGTIKVVRCEVADCSNSQEANRIFDLVLDYLVNNIESLDQEYASACQEGLWQLHNQIGTELTKAEAIFTQINHSEKWFPLFIKLFNELWENLSNTLENQLSELRSQRNQQDIYFKQQVNAAVKACRNNTGIPNIEQIEKRRHEVGGYPNAYYQYLNEVRAFLSKQFLSMDEGLKKSLLQAKSQIINILVTQGNLGALVEASNHDFLNQITSKIPENLTEIKYGFQIITEFEISYRGLIQHRIRQHLDSLTPDETSLKLSNNPSAQEIHINLKTLHGESLYKCETALEDLMCEPSQAVFAIIEEFVDRILRAENARNEWLIFFEEFRTEIWRDEFAQLEGNSRMRMDWLEVVNKAADINKLDLMQFLN
jgi:energy-coupling factor transporter ATP-binding protein EcfA2